MCSEKSAPTSMETEESHNLLSASWKPRKANDTIPDQVQRPESWGANAVNLNPRADDCMSAQAAKQHQQILLSSDFCSTVALKELDEGHSLTRAIYFTESTDLNKR